MALVVCTSCEGTAQIPDQFLGKPVRCPSCQATFVAAPSTSAAAPANVTAQPGTMLITCPKCNQPSRVSSHLKGRNALCPHCKNTFSVPADASAKPPPPAAPPPAPVSGPPIRFACPRCDHPQEVPASQAGTKFNCPNCGGRMQVPELPPNKTVLGVALPPPELRAGPIAKISAATPAPAPTVAPAPAPAAARKLVVIDGPDKGREFELPRTGDLLIGRGSATGARLNDPSVSRAHFKVEVGGDQVVLTDAGSQSGTLVNNQKVTRRLLHHDDIIQVGKSRLQLVSPDDMADAKTVGVEKLGDLIRQAISQASAKTLNVTCQCGQQLRAREKYAGTQVRCPVCGQMLQLPGTAPLSEQLDG